MNLLILLAKFVDTDSCRAGAILLEARISQVSTFESSDGPLRNNHACLGSGDFALRPPLARYVNSSDGTRIGPFSAAGDLNSAIRFPLTSVRPSRMAPLRVA